MGTLHRRRNRGSLHRFSENKLAPPVYITNFTVDTDTTQLSDRTEIQPGHFRYVFEYTALSLQAPQKNEFSYKLEGINDKWSEPSHRRQAEFTNLPPGQYTLQVRGSNNDNVGIKPIRLCHSRASLLLSDHHVLPGAGGGRSSFIILYISVAGQTIETANLN